MKFLTSTFFLLIFFITNTLANGTIDKYTVIIPKDWQPYYYLDENGKPTGFAIEVFEHIAEDINITYEYKIVPTWKDLWKPYEEGIVDFVPDLGISKKRESFSLFSIPTNTFKIVLYKRFDSEHIHTIDNLTNLKVAVVHRNIGQKVMNDYAKIQKKVYNNHFDAINALLSGQVDAFAYPKPLMDYNLRNLNIEDKILEFDKPLFEIKRAIGVSTKHPELLPMIDKSIEKFMSSEKYQKIFQKYFGKPKLVELKKEEVILIISMILVLLILSISLIARSRNLLTLKELEEQLNLRTKELQFSLDLYNKALSATDEGVWDWNVDTGKVYYAPTWKLMLGYEIDEIENDFSEWERLVHDEDLEKSRDEALRLARGEIDTYSIEFRMLCKDGSYKWILSRAKSVELDENNLPKRIVGTHIDLSEIKDKESKILEEKEKFESIFINSNDGIALFDLDSRFLEFNDAYLNMLGYSKEELKEKTCIELTPEEFRKESIEALENVIKEGSIENFEKKCTKKDGSQITVNMSAKLLADKKNILTVTKNVTSLKQIEEQERLISMGELISNISHQWRQPLTTITMAANNIKFDSELDELNSESVTEAMNIITENTNYLSQTIDTFREFLKENNEYLHISLNEVIKGALILTEASRKDNYIQLITELEEDIHIYGNENELAQAFINILNNAKDVLVEKEVVEKYIFVTLKRNEDNIELSFLDNGGGINNEIISKIFEPYFTTKHQAVGTGLGLSIAEKIIREHHKGLIKIENKSFTHNNTDFKGACFTIVFPLNEED